MAGGDLSWLGPEDDVRRRTARAGREYVATRTIFFDDFCAAAIESGIQQVVILAAGLDARAYRLPCLSGVLVYEIDQPAVHDFKASVLKGHGAAPLAELHSVPTDLRDAHWPDALESAGWQRSSSTAWLVEGLLPYLTSTEHDQLFRASDQTQRIGKPLGSRGLPPLDSSPGRATPRQVARRSGRDGRRDRCRRRCDSVHQAPRHQRHRVLANTRMVGQPTSRDSRVEMAHLGRPIPDDLADIAPASSLVTAIRQ